MSAASPRAPATRLNWRLISALIVAAVVALFIGANVHLVHVALESQPGCVPHAKAGAGTGTGAYSAAKPAC